MRVFVTGASGFIGSAVVPELIEHGHEVTGLARSDASAKAIASMGAKVLRGDLTDTASLRAGASASDGVVHLGFVHDFSNFMESIKTDGVAIETIAKALEGTHRPFVIASGTLGLNPGALGTEDIGLESPNPRIANHRVAQAYVDRGVRVSYVRLSPTVHGKGDHGFIAALIGIARDKKMAGYIGDGSNRWNAVHRLDAAPLFRLALEKAKPGARVHAVAEEAITTKAIAEVIGKKLGLPVASIAADAAAAHFGWMSMFWGMDQPASSAITQREFGWTPTHESLLADLEEGHYFR